MSDIINSFKRTGFALAEYITPVLKESKFRETGVLTPEEFILAGDHLVHHCPTWKWATGDPSRIKSYLPKEKQFLLTKNVPCYKRCKEMEYTDDYEKIIDSDDEDGGWVDTHHFINTNEQVSQMVQPTEVKKADYVLSKERSKDDDEEEDDDDEAADMDEFMASGLVDQEDKVFRCKDKEF